MTKKSIMTTYDINKDPKPTYVELGISLASRSHYETDDGYLVPCKTAVVFLTVPYSIAYTAKGGCDYNYLKTKLKEKGWGAAFTIMSVWATVSPDVANEIF